MLPALGKPLVVRVMDRLVQAGIYNFDVIVGDDEGGLASYLSSHWLPHVNVQFHVHLLIDTLADSLGRVFDRYSEPLLITTYNNFTHPHFISRLIKQSEINTNGLTISAASLSLSRSGLQHYAHIDAAQNITINADKGNSGLTVADIAIAGEDFRTFMTQSHGLGLADNSRELIALYDAYIKQGGGVHLVDTAWTLQIEADSDLLVLNSHLLSEGHDAHILSELPGTVQIIPPVRIDPHVSIGQHAKIGPYVYLEAGCSVGHDAQVSHAMVLQKAAILPEEIVSQAIISTRLRITGRP